jgi:hypothetical protein
MIIIIIVQFTTLESFCFIFIEFSTYLHDLKVFWIVLKSNLKEAL